MVEKKKYYPGMFDLIKGYAMITIIVEHVRSIFPDDLLIGANPSVPAITAYLFIHLFSFGFAMMPLFFIASGFGFTTTSMKKCIQKQAHILLKPYLLTGVFEIIIHICAHYFAFRYLPGAASSAVQVAVSHLLGISKSITLGGMDLFNIGSVWFLLALFFSWIFFNAITLYVSERYRPWIVLAFVCIGYAVGKIVVVPFCLTQSFIGIGYLYLGQQIKKQDWLFKKLPVSVWCVTISLALISFLFGQVSMVHSVWKLGLIDIAGAGCGAFLLVKATMLLNRYQNPFFDKLRRIGRYSLWIICIHTVESQCLPWYLYVDAFRQHPWPAFLILIVIRFFLIFAMYKVVHYCNKLLIKRKRHAKHA